MVIIFQENHSFDNVLGEFCISAHTCDGSQLGVLSDGSVIALSRTPDIVPNIRHDTVAQAAGIHGGLMNGFDHIQGCTAEEAEERWNSVLEDFRNVYRRIARLIVEAALNSPGNQTGD